MEIPMYFDPSQESTSE